MPQPAAGPLSRAAVDPRLRDRLRLSMLPGVGPRTLSDLVDHFGTAEAVLAASEVELRAVRGIGPKLAKTIRDPAGQVDIDALLSWCQEAGVAILSSDSAAYPAGLRELSDAPPVLFVRGELLKRDSLSVAIVGTRHATPYGRGQAERMAYGLAKAGVTVVSGLARGIDTAAHRGAIDGGGRTLAVFGSGLKHLYPPENAGLAEEILSSGAWLSEFHPETKPHSGTFPQRNRLISGLTHATLVIEAPERSGSLITARMAGEQGREVLALPGPVTSRASEGTNLLIRDGARLVRHVEDVLEALGPLASPVAVEGGRAVHQAAEALLNDRERLVLDTIGTEATGIDGIVQRTGLAVQQVLATISVLELRKLIRRLSSQYVSRV